MEGVRREGGGEKERKNYKSEGGGNDGVRVNKS